MAAQISDRQLSDAVCTSIKDGNYPEEEAVITAELSAGALESLSQMLMQARDEVKESIRELSRLSAEDVDGWITEAKQLRKELEESEQQSTTIATLQVQRQELESASFDARHKVDFLKRELAFNGHLTSTLEKILTLRNTVNGAQEALVATRIVDAVSGIREAEKQLEELEGCQRTGLVNLMRNKVNDIRENLARTAMFCWQRLVPTNHETYQMNIKGAVDGNMNLGMSKTIIVLQALGMLQGRLMQLKKDAEAVIFRPRIGKSLGSAKRKIVITGPVIKTVDERPEPTVERLIADVSAAFNYFDLVLPNEITLPFMQLLTPTIVAQLISGPLASSVPPDLSGITTFSNTLTLVRSFAETMGKRKWPGGTDLVNWVENAPRVWLQHRSNSTLSSIRELLARGVGKPRSVERVETQQVPIEDEAFRENGHLAVQQDDWNASWSDEENESEAVSTATSPKKADEASEEADTDAWGFDEDEDKPEQPKLPNEPNTETDPEENDAWGWGDDDEQPDRAVPPSSSLPKKSSKKARSSAPRKEQPSSREVTLRETYYITAMPEQIIEIVVQAVDDAERLTSAPVAAYGPVQPAGEGLYSLPGLILSMFRACAPNAYMHDPSGNMYLYNDSLYLSEQLQAFGAHHEAKHEAQGRRSPLNMQADISALETFGKASYGREMEAQRTIVRDLLDGAQGFAHCTEAPFNEACELAVSSVTDRLLALHSQWAVVLAPSALRQSLGSLLATVTDKMLVDVEELADISEPESQRLVAFCQRIERLERLFLPSDESNERDHEATEEEEEQRALRAAMAASVYAPGLLKFQWLSQILEGSLADIKYWWNESELALVFAPDEVVDLIKALFADSEHRRKAINEIRRGR